VLAIEKLPRNRIKSQLPQQSAAHLRHQTQGSSTASKPCRKAISPAALTPFHLPWTYPSLLHEENAIFIQLHLILEVFPPLIFYNPPALLLLKLFNLQDKALISKNQT
jgi:hypothetical protein